jgi:sulfur carrier protein
MRIKVNGKNEEVKDDTILDLLRTKGIEPNMVSVELNSKILDREEYGTARIQEGDAIEFLHFMGGGAAKPEPSPDPQGSS